MRYNPTLMKMCKPMYRLSIFLFTAGILLMLIGIIMVSIGKGWTTLFIALGTIILATVLTNIPNYYITGFIKMYDRSISAKDASAIANKHLRERDQTGNDTKYLIQDIIDGGMEDIKKRYLTELK